MRLRGEPDQLYPFLFRQFIQTLDVDLVHNDQQGFVGEEDFDVVEEIELATNIIHVFSLVALTCSSSV